MDNIKSIYKGRRSGQNTNRMFWSKMNEEEDHENNICDECFIYSFIWNNSGYDKDE